MGPHIALKAFSIGKSRHNYCQSVSTSTCSHPIPQVIPSSNQTQCNEMQIKIYAEVECNKYLRRFAVIAPYPYHTFQFISGPVPAFMFFTTTAPTQIQKHNRLSL